MKKEALKDLIKECIEEMAYPANFSMDDFNVIPTYKGKFRYANERLTKLAAGSARIIFKIDDEKVLKLAKNEKGLAQNNVETDGYLRNHPITAHVFDYDDKHDRPFWLEMEYAKKVTPKRFQQLTGFTLEEVRDVLWSHSGKKSLFAPATSELMDKAKNNEWMNDLLDMCINMGMSMPGDFDRPSTYGEVVRDGKPAIVVIDFGLTDTVYGEYYAR
jgi:hypothetical protein